MNIEYQKDGWPSERLSNEKKRNKWLHGDVKDISYQYVHLLFGSFVEKGELK